MIKYISILPITIYLIWILSTIGVQKSISETYYQIKNKIWFFIALNSTAWLFLIGYNIENVWNNKALFLVGSVIGIGYTTAAARFKEKLIGTIHYIGAFGAYISGYAFIVALKGFDSLYYIVPSLILIGLAKYYFYSNRHDLKQVYYGDKLVKESYGVDDHFIWWAEIIGFITIYLATIL